MNEAARDMPAVPVFVVSEDKEDVLSRSGEQEFNRRLGCQSREGTPDIVRKVRADAVLALKLVQQINKLVDLIRSHNPPYHRVLALG